jgi:HEPN domain-containing protein
MSEELHQWLERAEADFTSAQFNLTAPTPNPGLVMFLCQQCIEKLMKGVLVRNGDTPPKTHSLLSLSKRLARFEAGWKWDERELVWLTKGAVDFRYPGMGPDQSASKPAFELAERLRAALLPLLSKPTQKQ